jgi:diacylglycerol kinase (ATP)
MKTVAVVAHSGKTLGDGLGELRQRLAAAGYKAPIWEEVSSSRKAPKAIRRAIKKKAGLIFVWGGDGMVQRCIDALEGSKDVEMAIIPAGTANLLATNLGIPKDIAKAVRLGLKGARQKLDVGVMNGERFAVMAGTGFDALTMRGVDGADKERFGSLAYVRSGLKAIQAAPVHMTIEVDGNVWFKGEASTLLAGNVGTITGGFEIFPQASATDGMLEIGVVTASTPWQWVRVFSRIARGHLERSPLIKMTRGKKINVELARKLPYELDGGARAPANHLKIRIKPAAVTICVPPLQAATRPSSTQTSAARKRKPRPRRSAPEVAPAEPTFGPSDGATSPSQADRADA